VPNGIFHFQAKMEQAAETIEVVQDALGKYGFSQLGAFSFDFLFHSLFDIRSKWFLGSSHSLVVS
jgi:hypothetical protein